jgi:hypothetical protein
MRIQESVEKRRRGYFESLPVSENRRPTRQHLEWLRLCALSRFGYVYARWGGRGRPRIAAAQYDCPRGTFYIVCFFRRFRQYCSIDMYTLTHKSMFVTSIFIFLQVGHYLGLFHTFGTSCNERDGDQVNDTPVHTNKFAHAIANCGVSKVIPWDSCPNAPGKDPLNNYMSYVKNSECRSQFTKGQVERMLGQYELYRNKGPKIAVVVAPPPPTCLAFLSTCKVDADCCGQNKCVYFSASNRHLCWL